MSLCPLRRLVAGASVVAALGLLSGCGQPAAAAPAGHLPGRILPGAIDGYTVHEETTARAGFDVPRSQVAEGRLYTLRAGGAVFAALEVGLLRPGLDSSDVDTRFAIAKQIGNGAYRYYRLGGQWVADQTRPDVHLLVWFPDGSPGTFEVLTVSNQLAHAQDFLGSLLRYQEGR